MSSDFLLENNFLGGREGAKDIIVDHYWLSSWNFFLGGAKSIVIQISFVMLLFSYQILGRDKSFQGGKTVSGGHPPAPLWKKARLSQKSNGLLFLLFFININWLGQNILWES